MVPADSRRISPVPRYSGSCSAAVRYAYRAFTCYGSAFQQDSAWHNSLLAVLQPLPAKLRGLGSSPFARHYSGNHYCFLFLQVLRCFSSLGSPPPVQPEDDWPSASRVAPFGDPRIKACLQLPVAYRSLPRPSSPPGAKASTMRPCSL